MVTMEQNQFYDQPRDEPGSPGKDQREANLRLVETLVNQINLMTFLLYEIKTDTPRGKALKVLLHLFSQEGQVSSNGAVILTNISLPALADLTEISPADFQASLDYLEEHKVILYRPSSKRF